MTDPALPTPTLTATVHAGAIVVHRTPGQPDDRAERLFVPTCRRQRRSVDTAARFLATYRGPRRTPRRSAKTPRRVPSILSDREIERIILAVGRGMGTFTDDDCERAARWATRIRWSAAVLDLVLAGELAVVVPPGSGEPKFVRRTTGARP